MSAPLFTRFVRDLDVTLTPGQRVIARVSYDGVDPADLDARDRELARQIFGDVDVVPDDARHVFVAVCGARAGKSYVLCGLRILHLAHTVPLTTLAPGERATALIVAPDMRLGRQTLRYALGAAKATPKIASRIASESSDGFILKREGGRSVAIEVLPATRGGSAVRGRSLVGAVLDESAFFRDREYLVNDEEIFKAIAPRVMAGGQIIVASTPWAEAGLLYQLFRDNHGDPGECLAAHAPTTLLRNDARTVALVERERRRDPDNCRREHDAEFMTAGTGLFLDAAAIEAVVDDELRVPRDPHQGRPCAAGADFGFVSDSSALALVQDVGGITTLVALEERRPSRGAPLLPSAVAADFAKHAKRYGCRAIMADGHYALSIHEHLKENGVAFARAPDGQNAKVNSYLLLRRLINERLIRLPRHTRLLNQLRSLISKPTPGGGMTITSPRRGPGSGHGDLVSALVCALVHSSRSASHEPSPAEQAIYDEAARRPLAIRNWEDRPLGPFGDHGSHLHGPGLSGYIVSSISGY